MGKEIVFTQKVIGEFRAQVAAWDDATTRGDMSALVRIGGELAALGRRVVAGGTNGRWLREVRAYAMDHYDEGWDVVVEAMGDDQIMQLITDAGAVDVPGAIDAVRGFVELREAHADDIKGTAF